MKSLIQNKGFSLVEVTIALGVASFCLLAIFGLLPAGVNSNRASIEQTAAANLATRIVADLQAAGTNSVSPNFAVALNGSTTLYLRDDGKIGASPSDSRYRATITTKQPGTGGAHAATVARVLVSWPASVDPSAAASGSFETVTALNRN